MKHAEEVRALFEPRACRYASGHGIHGYKPRTVYAVLCGQTKDTRGVSHEIAVALGLKAKSEGTLREV